MGAYEIVCDRMTVGMRTIKLKMDSFSVNILHNSQMDEIHVAFRQPDPFGPDISYVDGTLVLTYGYVVVPEGFRDDFEKAYEKTLKFCSDMKPLLAELVEKMKKGEPV